MLLCDTGELEIGGCRETSGYIKVGLRPGLRRISDKLFRVLAVQGSPGQLSVKMMYTKVRTLSFSFLYTVPKFSQKQQTNPPLDKY